MRGIQVIWIFSLLAVWVVWGDKNRKTHNSHESHSAAATFWFAFLFQLLSDFFILLFGSHFTNGIETIAFGERQGKIWIFNNIHSRPWCIHMAVYFAIWPHDMFDSKSIFFLVITRECRKTKQQRQNTSVMLRKIHISGHMRALLSSQPIRFEFESWVKNSENGTLFPDSLSLSLFHNMQKRKVAIIFSYKI